MKLLHLMTIAGLTATMALTGCKKDDPDPCDNVTCLNGSTCSNGSCACAAGYEGSTCGTEVRAKFIGAYNGTLSCPGQNGTVNLTITNSAAGITSIVFGDGVDTWVGTVSGSSVTIANQTLNGGTTISGSGQLSGLLLSLNLNLGGSTCTYTGTKQ
ncbi:MAG: hypothetical protein R2818_09360 [Flavobacteriales bacterium]